MVSEAVHPEANIIFGATIDDALGDEVRVTVIAAGFDGGRPKRQSEAPQARRPVVPQQTQAETRAAAQAAASRLAEERVPVGATQARNGEPPNARRRRPSRLPAGRTGSAEAQADAVRWRRRPRHPGLPEVARACTHTAAHSAPSTWPSRTGTAGSVLRRSTASTWRSSAPTTRRRSRRTSASCSPTSLPAPTWSACTRSGPDARSGGCRTLLRRYLSTCGQRRRRPSRGFGRRHRRPHLLGHLVAGAAHVRPDPGGDRSRAPSVAHRATAAGTTPATRPGRPEWTAPITPRVGVGEQHRHAVGGPDHQHQAGPVGDQPSQSAVARRRRPSTTVTSAPCTWCMSTSVGAGREVGEQRALVLARSRPGRRRRSSARLSCRRAQH